MAKPIRATPTLNGEEAIQFVKNILREEKRPSKARITTITTARSRYSRFSKIMKSVQG
ncbi:hypothetical protein KKE92_04855 [Candidatus Micrarchaeota archaeon]|nr:hypothetical protein [Candidatus Micrarchaeota archaeon]